MKTGRRPVRRGLALLGAALLGSGIGAGLPPFAGCGGGSGRLPVDPASYPVIDEKEMGQLRWILSLADQPLDDFGNFEGRNQGDLTSYRYSIAFAAYFLAVEQYHKLPAWSEEIRPAFDRLIRKILEKAVWEYWAETSRGVPTLEPDMRRPYPESHDPVGEKNIMYSGHLGHMVNLYEMLYRDFAWDAPGSIVFAWSDEEKYVYDNHSLERVMHEQFRTNPYHSICCEPNAVFSECNQHPVLSFILYDHTHGTSLAAVNDLYMAFLDEKEMILPATHETAMLYLVRQDSTLSNENPHYGNLLDLFLGPAIQAGIVTLESATADGWNGAFMHAWQPDAIERHYPYWKEHHVIDTGGDVAEIKKETWEPLVRYGFFATLASEMGDSSLRDKLLEFAERQYAPVWQGGAYHYPYDLGRGCTSLTDRLLAPSPARRPGTACGRSTRGPSGTITSKSQRSAAWTSRTFSSRGRSTTVPGTRSS